MQTDCSDQKFDECCLYSELHFLRLLKINSNGKKCSIVSLYSAVFWDITPMLNQCMEITIKFFGKPCMKWKSHLKDFSWYKIEPCIVIRTRVVII